MTFVLGKRSLSRLKRVDERLQEVVHTAIQVTSVDFGVICGLRTIQQQEELVRSGASQTLKSKHLDGLAVDLMAYVGKRGSWELNLYDDIADAMAVGARKVGCKIRWGAAWTSPSIADFTGTMEQAMMKYIDIRRKEGRRPFIDGPHFELMD